MKKLVIDNATLADSGKYYCKTTNEYGDSFKFSYVTVIGLRGGPGSGPGYGPGTLGYRVHHNNAIVVGVVTVNLLCPLPSSFRTLTFVGVFMLHLRCKFQKRNLNPKANPRGRASVSSRLFHLSWFQFSWWLVEKGTGVKKGEGEWCGGK